MPQGRADYGRAARAASASTPGVVRSLMPNRSSPASPMQSNTASAVLKSSLVV